MEHLKKEMNNRGSQKSKRKNTYLIQNLKNEDISTSIFDSPAYKFTERKTARKTYAFSFVSSKNRTRRSGIFTVLTAGS